MQKQDAKLDAFRPDSLVNCPPCTLESTGSNDDRRVLVLPRPGNRWNGVVIL